MSEKTGILRSRYIGATFAALLLLIAGITAASVFIADRNLKSPEKIEKAVSDFAEVVIPFGRYEEVRVLDGEKEIAAVKEKDGFVKLIDFNENLLLDLEPFTNIGMVCGKNMTLKRGDGWCAVNYEDLLNGGEMPHIAFDKVFVSKTGRYYIGEKYNEKTAKYSHGEIRDYDGNLIFKSPYNVEFALTDDAVSVYPDDGPGQVVEMKSGKTLFTLEGENILDYFTDGRFQPPPAGTVIRRGSISGDDSYIIVSIKKEGKSFDGVMDRSGKILFSEENRKAEGKDRNYLEVIGNTVVAERWNNEIFAKSYIDIPQSEKAGEPVSYNIGRRSEPFCMMDFDDGIALVNKDKPSDNDPFTSEFIIPMTKRWYYRRDDTKWMDSYEWSFVNEERKEICDYIFSGAFPTDNRYAAVAVSDMWGVIRFK